MSKTNSLDDAQGDLKPLLPLFGSMLQGALTVVMISVALPAIKQAFGISAEAVAWVMTGYFLPLMVLAPIAGNLADLSNPRRILFLGLIAHYAGYFVSGFSDVYYLLLLGRVLQGAGSAALIAVPLGFISRAYSMKQVSRSLSIMYLSIPAANLVGPITAGVLVDQFGWPSIFHSLLVLGLLNFCAIFWLVPPLEQKTQNIKFDWLGAITLTSGMLAIVLLISGDSVMLSRTYSAVVLTIGLTCFVLFGIIEQRKEEPLVDLGIFRKNDFLFSSLGICLRMFAFNGVQFLVPLFLADVQDRSTTQIGLVFLIQPLTLFVGILISGRLTDRFGPRLPALIGFILPLSSSAYAITFTQFTEAWSFVLVLALAALGAGFHLVPFGKAALKSISNDKKGAAAGLYNMVRYLGAVLSPPLLATVLDASSVLQSLPINNYQQAFLVMVIICVIGIVVSMFVEATPYVSEASAIV